MNLIRQQISGIIQDVVDGNASACEAHSILKELEQVIKSGITVIQPDVLNEARDFNKGEVYYGGVWEVKGTPTYLDFSKDEMFVNLNKSALSRKAALNNSYKSALKGQTIVDEATGEQVPVLPVKTPSKEIAIFKAK